MRSISTRVAHLNRMLKRLEGQHARIRQLVSSRILTQEAGQLATDLLSKAREEAVEELRTIELNESQGTASMMAKRLATRTSVRVQDSPATVLRQERDRR